MPRELRGQVLIFFTKQQVRAYNVRTILSQLPFDLRSSILLYLYRDIIKKVSHSDRGLSIRVISTGRIKTSEKVHLRTY